MKLQFLHKNIGKIYDINNGANFSASYNEDLGSGMVIIRSEDDINIEPYDEVKVININGLNDLYMCIDTYDKLETRNKTGEKVYNYQITLMSQTKLLECYTCPSLSITPIKDYKNYVFPYLLSPSISEGDVFEYNETYQKQEYSENPTCNIRAGSISLQMCFDIEFSYTSSGFHLKLTKNSYPFPPEIGYVRVEVVFKSKPEQKIITYLERYNDLYGPKVRTAGGYVNKFSFSPECATKFADTCPELQFNAPTLRECFTVLMMVKDCIPIVSNNVISFIDISSKNTLRDKNDERISYVKTSQSSYDYVSDLKINLKNVIQDKSYSYITEFVTFRNFGYAGLDDENLKLETQHPIYAIKSLRICFVAELKATGVGDDPIFSFHYLNQDMTNCVKEKKEFDTLDIAINDDIPISDFYKYQNTCVYYNRGSKTIENFSNRTQSGIWWNVKLLDLWIKKLGQEAANRWLISGNKTFEGIWLKGEEKEYRQWNAVTFYIEYLTKSDITVKAGKNINTTTHREAIDNQSNNYVNSFTQGLLEYSKVNRLGNKMKSYSARYDMPVSYNDLPKAGDYFEGNEIIYKVDYQFNENSIDVTMYACPNYVLRNYFTGVQSKLRSWKIVDTDEAFYREENYKIYCEFNKNEFIDNNLLSKYTFNSNKLLEKLLGSLTDNILDVKMSIIQTDARNRKLEMETIKNVVGNSVCFTIGFYDNFSNGMYISDLDGNKDGQQIINGSLQEYVSYVDDNGNFYRMTISLLYDYFPYTRPPSPSDWSRDEDRQLSQGLFPQIRTEFEEIDQMVERGRMLPISTVDEMGSEFKLIDDNILYYKDNKEIPKITYQFEYCSSYQDFLLAEEFMKGHIEAIRKTDLSIKVFDGNIVGKTLPTGGSDISIDNLNISYNQGVSAHLTINGMEETQTAFIYNTTNNQVLLSFYGNSIYMNLLIDRNKNVYERQGDNLVIVDNHD